MKKLKRESIIDGLATSMTLFTNGQDNEADKRAESRALVDKDKEHIPLRYLSEQEAMHNRTKIPFDIA